MNVRNLISFHHLRIRQGGLLLIRPLSRETLSLVLFLSQLFKPIPVSMIDITNGNDGMKMEVQERDLGTNEMLKGTETLLEGERLDSR